LLDLFGWEIPAAVKAGGGVSWLAEWENDPVERGPVFAVAVQPYVPDVERPDLKWRNARKPHAIVWGPWKYIYSEYNEVEELYHLERDPGERDNLLPLESEAGESSAAYERLRKRLTSFREQAQPLPSGYDASQAAETARRLQQFGYGNGDSPGD